MRRRVSDDLLARVEAVLPDPGDGLLPMDVAAIVRTHQPASIYHALIALWRTGRAERELMKGNRRAYLYSKVRRSIVGAP